MNVIIVEDEPLMAEHLARLLREVAPEIQLLTTLESVAAGVAHFATQPEPPDLFFSDISLSDGLSFELFRRIGNQRPVIFCTAHDEYALDAFATHGIDYLLKPFTGADVRRSLDKYHQLTATARPVINFGQIQQYFTQRQRTAGTSFLAHRGERIIPVTAESVALFYLRDEMTNLHDFRGERYLIDGTLESVEQRLGPEFFRLNRQCIIQRRAVDYVERHFARKLLVKTVVPIKEQLLVSKSNAGRFLAWLEGG